jgi:ABC-type lipoprotein export system ATPase subunit
MPLLVLRDVRKEFDGRVVLDRVNLSVEAGDTVAVMGPSGSGKSTLLNIIGLLDRAASGSVLHNGVDLAHASQAETARFRARRVGFVFQEHHLLPQLTAIENVLLPAVAAGEVPNRERALHLLGQMDVAHRRDAFPWEMSGGERQRVAIARALMNAPGLILCDEPTGNLDRHPGQAVIELRLVD